VYAQYPPTHPILITYAISAILIAMYAQIIHIVIVVCKGCIATWEYVQIAALMACGAILSPPFAKSV
jgi:hypothetical protein